MKDIKETIQEIIKDISKETIFDIHAIIEYLMQYHSDVYLSSYQSGWTTEDYHREISKVVSSFEGTIAREGRSWSLNIRKNFSENNCWRKL